MKHSLLMTSFESYSPNTLSTTERDAHLREEEEPLQRLEGTVLKSHWAYLALTGA